MSDWQTPPGSPWERNEDATFDTLSLSWDTEDFVPQDEATVPERWDEGEEESKASQTSTSEIWTTAGEEDEDSLPELVSGSEDSGYEFLNTPKAVPSEEKAEEEPEKDVRKKRYSMTEEEEVKTQLLTKRKQEIWDNQYLIHHGKLAENKGSYEAGFILQEILGPRPETPLLDDIASAEQLEQLERERMLSLIHI